FCIEQRLREEMKMPVMHDDQHGTAMISGAALLNAVELQKKKIDKLKFVVSGAGAAAMACVKLYVALGANPDNFIMFDAKGVIHSKRDDISEDKKTFAIKTGDISRSEEHTSELQ